MSGRLLWGCILCYTDSTPPPPCSSNPPSMELIQPPLAAVVYDIYLSHCYSVAWDKYNITKMLLTDRHCFRRGLPLYIPCALSAPRRCPPAPPPAIFTTRILPSTSDQARVTLFQPLPSCCLQYLVGCQTAWSGELLESSTSQ